MSLPIALLFHAHGAERSRLRTILSGHFNVIEAQSAERLWQCTSESPALIIAQLLLPKRRGVELLSLIHRRFCHSEIIALSPVAAPGYVVAAVKAGAFAFLSEHDDAETVLKVAYDAAGHQRRKAKQEPVGVSAPSSQSPCMLQALAQLEELGRTDTHVLIAGELGTGRKTLARMLHRSSQHAGALRLLDCSNRESVLAWLRTASPAEIAPEQASVHNSICLLNIEQLAPTELSALAKVCKHSAFMRLADGSRILARYRIVGVVNDAVDVDGRSNTAVLTGMADALSAIVVRLPPLRRRMEDLPHLCAQLALSWSRKYGLATKQLTSGAMEVLTTYAWPGNILELRNLIERLTLLEGVSVIDESMIPLEIYIGGWRRGLTYRKAMEQMERQFLHCVLSRGGGCRRRAAERLQLSYSTLKFRLRKLRISNPESTTSTILAT